MLDPAGSHTYLARGAHGKASSRDLGTTNDMELEPLHMHGEAVHADTNLI